MILALDDDVPEAVSEAIRTQEAVRDLWTIRLGGATLTADRGAAHPRRPRRDARPRPARRVDVHRRGPLPGPGRLAADRRSAGARPRSSPAGWPRRTRRRPCRSRPAGRVELVHSPLGRDDPDRRGHRGGARAPTGSAVAAARRSGLPRDRPGRLAGPPSRRDRRALRRRSSRPGGGRRSRPGRPAASRSPRSRRASGRRSPALLARLADGRPPGTPRPLAGRGLRRPAARPPVVDRRRPRRRLQGRPADPVRPAARAVLDVVDGPVRRSPSSSSAPGGRSCAPTT